MKIVSDQASGPKERKTVDYAKLADYYNRCEDGDAVEIDKVYNITLFRKSLDLRGITQGVDYQAFNKDGKTYVKRISKVRMTKD